MGQQWLGLTNYRDPKHSGTEAERSEVPHMAQRDGIASERLEAARHLKENKRQQQPQVSKKDHGSCA